MRYATVLYTFLLLLQNTCNSGFVCTELKYFLGISIVCSSWMLLIHVFYSPLNATWVMPLLLLLLFSITIILLLSLLVVVVHVYDSWGLWGCLISHSGFDSCLSAFCSVSSIHSKEYWSLSGVGCPMRCLLITA